MTDIVKLQKKLDSIYRAHNNLPVDFDFIKGICEYVKVVEKSDLLKAFIEKEHQDLRATRRKIPKATNDQEYEIMGKILDEKLYTNCSEDYMELTFVTEAIEELKDKSLANEIASMDLKKPHNRWELIQYGIWEFLNNKVSRKNYYVQNGQSIKHKWQKVHRYLTDELTNPELKERMHKANLEKHLKLEYNNGTLWIKGKPIIIKAQKRQTDEDRLMQYIFKNGKSLRNSFLYADVAESAFQELDFDKNKRKWRKYWDICQRINQKVKQVFAEDFLIATSERAGKVSINEHFLKNLI